MRPLCLPVGVSVGPNNGNICPYLADIDAAVLLVVGPVAQCQAELLQAVPPAQLHFLFHTQTNKYCFKLQMLSHGEPVISRFFPPQWISWIPKPILFQTQNLLIGFTVQLKSYRPGEMRSNCRMFMPDITATNPLGVGGWGGGAVVL